jgi:hypothetical protein
MTRRSREGRLRLPCVAHESSQEQGLLARIDLLHAPRVAVWENSVRVIAHAIREQGRKDGDRITSPRSEPVENPSMVDGVDDADDGPLANQVPKLDRKGPRRKTFVPPEEVAEGGVRQKGDISKDKKRPLPSVAAQALRDRAGLKRNAGADAMEGGRSGVHPGSLYWNAAPPKIIYSVYRIPPVTSSGELPCDFPVVELRRYTVKAGERANFVEYFETYFPEAFQQLSVMIFGTFSERGNPERFAWLRGFHDNFHRGYSDSAFYYGPVWREHRGRMNDRLDDSENVIQLTPVDPSRPMPVLPAVDPVFDGRAEPGVVVAIIYPIRTGEEASFLAQSTRVFGPYRRLGLREVAVLRSLEANNTFPQLPIRTDGPFVVWLGVHPTRADFDTHALRDAEATQVPDSASSLLRSVPELVILDPTRRSRLRWRPEWFRAESGA